MESEERRVENQTVVTIKFGIGRVVGGGARGEQWRAIPRSRSSEG